MGDDKTKIFYDIETYRYAPLADIIIGSKEFSAPSNYKDPQKIAENIAEQRARALDKAALHWTTGKVVCICATAETGAVFEYASHDEKAILGDFKDWCNDFQKENGPSCLVGKSNHIFDDGFLIGRYMFHRIGFPQQLVFGTRDINNIFGYGNSHPQQAKLQDYALALCEAKKLANGMDVAGMVDAGKWDEIREYCKQDVKLTKEIWEIYTSCGGIL
jgi:hypothetical protein